MFKKPEFNNLNYDRRLYLEELLTIITALLINLLIILFSDIISAPAIFFINTGIIIFIIIIPFFHRNYHGKIISVFRDWYVIVILFAIYLECKYLIPLINPHDIDKFLIQSDRLIFLGNDPAVLLERFTFPPVTEFMQIVYASFYFLPLTLCVLLYKNKSKADFHVAATIILLGFYISFMGYYLTPAIGPRFTLDSLQTYPLKGIFVFEFLKNTIARIEGITRDCFPSGHILVSLLTLILADRYHKSFFPAALVWSVLQIPAAIYLRYHYLSDIIAGVILVLPVYLCGMKLFQYYTRADRFFIKKRAVNN